MLKFLVLCAGAFFSQSGVFCAENKEPQQYEPTQKSEILEKKELDQKKLFDKIKNGVVVIKVIAHVIMEKYFNDKMWFGTGFLIDREKGLIVTNSHVAGQMAVCTYEIKFVDGTKAEAKLEYADDCYDFAILSVDKNSIPKQCVELEFDKKTPSINTSVYSMGNSYNNEFSTYQGTIFDLHSILWLKPFPEQSIQFSGLTVPGASGSPVFGSDGKVLGLLYGGKFVSGAALPISYIIPAIDAIKEGKTFQRYFWGFISDYVSLQDAAEAGIVDEEACKEYEKSFPQSNNKILYVSKKLSAFNKSDEIESGDVIWKVEGELIGPELQRLDAIAQSKKGDDLEVTVYREGKQKNIKIPTYKLSDNEEMRLFEFAGAVFFETNPEVAILKGSNEKGVYITNSEPGSPFTRVSSNPEESSRGLFKITEIDGHEIKTLDDMVEVTKKSLLSKPTFHFKFISQGEDGQEKSAITKHIPKFASASLYTYKNKTKSWEVERVL